MKIVSIMFLASIATVSGQAFAQSGGSLPDVSSASLRALKATPVGSPQLFPTAAPSLPAGLADMPDLAAALKNSPGIDNSSAQSISIGGQPRSSTGSLELNLPPGVLSAMGAASALKSSGPEAASLSQAPTVVLLGVQTRKTTGQESAVQMSPWLGAMK